MKKLTSFQRLHKAWVDRKEDDALVPVLRGELRCGNVHGGLRHAVARAKNHVVVKYKSHGAHCRGGDDAFLHFSCAEQWQERIDRVDDPDHVCLELGKR